MNIFFHLVILLCFGQVLGAHGQTTLTAKMEQIRNTYKLPGLAAGIVQLNHKTEITTVGVRETGKADLIKKNDRFHLGSQTKSMTAYLISNLVKAKKINFDSEMSEIFPEFKIHHELSSMTIRMLLVHRSGLSRGILNYEKIREELNRAKTIVEARKIITKHLLENAPSTKPDTVDSYSNAGYLVLGHILEKFSSKSFEEHLTLEVFKPLKMKSCGFGASPDVIGHYINRGILTALDDDNLAFWGPAGRVHCNLQDWGEFIKLHLGRMKKNKDLYQVEPTSQMDYTLSAMFRLKRDWSKEDVFTHSGTNLLNYARLWIDPAKNRAYLIVTNRGGDETFSGEDSVLDETANAVNDLIRFIISQNN